jgi:hypothetical protein
MFGAEAIQIEILYPPVLDPPSALNHHPIGVAGTAEDEGGEWIAGAGEAKLVETEHSKIRLHTGGDRANIGSADTGSRALGRPAERIMMGNVLGAMMQALQEESVAQFLNQVGTVIARRSVDADAETGAPAASSAGT